MSRRLACAGVASGGARGALGGAAAPEADHRIGRRIVAADDRLAGPKPVFGCRRQRVEARALHTLTAGGALRTVRRKPFAPRTGPVALALGAIDAAAARRSRRH